MKKQLLMTLTALAAVALLAGCGRDAGKAEGDGHDHAGHDHGSHAAPNKSNAKCAAHQAPKELCFICDASLREPGRFWCAEHG